MHSDRFYLLSRSRHWNSKGDGGGGWGLKKTRSINLVLGHLEEILEGKLNVVLIEYYIERTKFRRDSSHRPMSRRWPCRHIILFLKPKKRDTFSLSYRSPPVQGRWRRPNGFPPHRFHVLKMRSTNSSKHGGFHVLTIYGKCLQDFTILYISSVQKICSYPA